MRRRGVIGLSILLLALSTWAAYRLIRTDIIADVYRDRLAALGRDYESLRHHYNEAVKQTAVTELVVEKGRLSVIVRTIEGVRQTIETPFDPYSEIFVDYLVLDGRLWIRRVFDSQTPPDQGIVIDPHLQWVDWDAPGLAYGKAVYRRLEEGRWVVTMTGNGSLGLIKQTDKASTELAVPPPIQDYPPIEQEIADGIGRVGIADMLKKLITPGG